MVHIARTVARRRRAAHRLAALMAPALWVLVGLGGVGCTECEVDYDCAGTRVCSDGVCEALVCRRDEDCPPGNQCAENSCRENPARPAPDAPDAVIIRPGE